MSDIDQGDLEDVTPEPSPEGPAPEPEPAAVDVAALQEELRKTTENYTNLQAAVHEARGENKALKAQLAETAEPQAEPQPQYDPDDLPTMGTVQQIAEQIATKKFDELKRDMQAQQESQGKAIQNANEMRTQHEDFQQVMDDLNPFLLEHPEIQQALLKDPSTTYTKAYELGTKMRGALDKRATADAIANPVNQPGTMNQPGRSRPNPHAKKDFSQLTQAEAEVILKQAHEQGPDAVARLIGEA